MGGMSSLFLILALMQSIPGNLTLPRASGGSGAASPSRTVTFYVASGGSDMFSGRLPSRNSAGTDGPFATLDHARHAVQALSKDALGSVTVEFRGGPTFFQRLFSSGPRIRAPSAARRSVMADSTGV